MILKQFNQNEFQSFKNKKKSHYSVILWWYTSAPTCKINYVNMQHLYVDIQLFYVDMQLACIYVKMELNYVNVLMLTCNLCYCAT